MRYCRHCQKNVDVSLDTFSNIEICSICGIALGDFHLPAGTILGGFQIESELAHDPMGTVYRARQLNLERNVALKILSAQLSQDLDFVDHFFEEARAAAGLNHPNIVQVFDAGSTPEGIYYLAMELIEGETLASRIKREGSIPPETALDIAIRIAGALGYAWEKQELFHGDIKPEDIIMNSSGDAKLANLGLAKSKGRDIKNKTAVQLLYLAPELISEEVSEPNLKSDIYSFAATLYHMLSGIPPFPETDPVELCRMHLNEEIVPLNQKNSDIDAGLSDFISKMLSKKLSERPDSWDEIAAMLEELLQNRETFINSQGISSRIDDKKLYKLALALSAGIILLVLVLLGLFITQKRNSALPSPDAAKKELFAKWEKLKASTKFLTPANAITEVENYIESNKQNLPSDSKIYLEQLKKKKTDEESTTERKKTFKKELEDTVNILNNNDIEKLQLNKLRELKYRITSLQSKAKHDESLAPLLTKNYAELFMAKIKIIEKLIETLRELDFQKAALEESERLKKEGEEEKKSKVEHEQKRKLITEENMGADDYFMTIYEFMKNPSKKRTAAQFALDINELSKRNSDKFPTSFKECLEVLKSTSATPMEFTDILAKCDSLLKGASLPVKSLQEPGYKVDGADSTGVKLMIESGQAKIGKKIKWSTLKNEEIYELVKSILLAPANSEKIETPLKKLIMLNLLLAKKNQEADSYLSKITDLSDSDKKIWQDIVNQFTSIDSEIAAIILWHDINKNTNLSEYLKKQLAQNKTIFSETEAPPLQLQPLDKFIFFNNKYADTITYQRYNFLINNYLTNNDLSAFQAIRLIRKTEPELKSGNVYKSLDLVMSAMTRYGNVINASKPLKGFFEKQKAATLSRIQENSSIKSENDNKLPFYYWENEIPADALVFRNILVKNKIVQSSSMLSFLTASAEIDAGDWSNARKFMKSNRNFTELANTKGTYINWIPPLLFGSATIAARYNDTRLLLELTESLENISHLSDDDNIRPLAMALAMELNLSSRNIPSLITIAESYKFENKPSKNDIRLALLHLTALLQQNNVNINDFTKHLETYQKIFANEPSLKSDFQWCRFVVNMLRSSDMPAPIEVDALEKTDCFAKNICEVMLADAFAIKLYKNPSLANSPSTVRIFRIIQSKLTNNMVAGDLLNKLNLISLFLAPDTETMLQSTKSMLNDTRIAAITYYPQLIIFRSGIEILKNPNSREEQKKNLKKLLEASIIVSDAELYCPNLISDNDSTEYIKNMIANNSYQQAFTAGAFNILANSDNSKTVQSTIKILNDNSAYLTWQERLFLKKLENLLK